MDNFFDYLRNISEISQESENDLRKVFALKKYKKRSNFLRKGTVPKNISFLDSGVVRIFSISEEDKEFNHSIITNRELIIPLRSLISRTPCRTTIQCLEDCQIVEANYKEFMSLVGTNKDISVLHQKILESLYISAIERNKSLQILNGTERYLALRENNPSIDNLISLKHIASYLGITSVQLSRIKRKLLFAS